MGESPKSNPEKLSVFQRAAPKPARAGLATLAANAAFIALASWMGTLGWGVSEKTALSAKLQVPAAQAWMKGWPQEAQGLRATGSAQCPQGPSRVCAAVAVSSKDLGGNERQEIVWFWPEQNWAQAWVPLAQWRLAHSMAMAGAKTQHGQRLIARWANSAPPAISQKQREGMLAESRRPMWRMGLIEGPIAGEESRYQDAENAPWPIRAMSENGAVALFADGSALPLLESQGQWFIWAAGPADQAGRLAAAIATGKDSGAGSSPAPAGWSWKTEAQSLGLNEDRAGELELARQAREGRSRQDLAVAMLTREAARPGAGLNPDDARTRSVDLGVGGEQWSESGSAIAGAVGVRDAERKIFANPGSANEKGGEYPASAQELRARSSARAAQAGGG